MYKKKCVILGQHVNTTCKESIDFNLLPIEAILSGRCLRNQTSINLAAG